jgi:hypothetical protein
MRKIVRQLAILFSCLLAFNNSIAQNGNCMSLKAEDFQKTINGKQVDLSFF